MMQSLNNEWLLLFASTKYVIRINTTPVSIVCNDKIFINDILLYSNHDNILLHYFPYVPQVFTKYRLSFKITKCDLFKPRVEFVRHGLTTYGNCPAESKFDLIKH